MVLYFIYSFSIYICTEFLEYAGVFCLRTDNYAIITLWLLYLKLDMIIRLLNICYPRGKYYFDNLMGVFHTRNFFAELLRNQKQFSKFKNCLWKCFNNFLNYFKLLKVNLTKATQRWLPQEVVPKNQKRSINISKSYIKQDFKR